MGAISAQLSSWAPMAGHMPNLQNVHHHHHHHHHDPHGDIRGNILCGIKTFAEGQDASNFLQSIINQKTPFFNGSGWVQQNPDGSQQFMMKNE